MSSRARVILLTCEFGPIRAGGLGTMITALCRSLDRARFAPVVVLPRSGHHPRWPHLAHRRLPYGDADAYEVEGLEVWLLSNPVLDGVIYPEPYEHAGIKKTDEFGERVAELLPALEGDLLHLHDAYGYKALYQARRLGLPSILTIHRLHEDEPPLAFAELAAARLVDQVTTVSHGYRRDRADFFSRLPRVQVVPNGIDLDFWSPELLAPAPGGRPARRRALLERLGLGERPTLAFVGRFDRDQKGIDVLLDAWQALAPSHTCHASHASHAPVNLVIAGEGNRDLTARVERAAGQHPGRLAVINRLLPHHEVRELFGAVDAAIIPSRYEPFGLILLEAMAMGALPIASAVGGLRDVLEHAPFARCVPPGDAGALAQAIEELARRLAGSTAELTAELAAERVAACARAHQYSAGAMAARYEQLYHQLLGAEAWRQRRSR